MTVPDPVARQLGARVRDVRERRGCTLVDLAGETGLSVAYLSEVERGQATPTSRTMASLGRWLADSDDEHQVLVAVARALLPGA